MRYLFRQPTIVDPASPHHGQRRDILIENGALQSIGKALPAGDARVFEAPGLHVSPGWLDMGVWCGDPGLEHREDISSVQAAAAAGGFTGLLLWPDTAPPVQSKAAIKYILEKGQGHAVEVFPTGALTADLQGKAFTEMIDMNRAGALAFTDGLHPVSDSGTLNRALQYVLFFDGLVIHFPLDKALAAGGQMHEGLVSTGLGLKGIPRMAEEVVVDRDLRLLEYTGSRLHLANISSAGSVNLIRRAKQAGLRVTASVAIANLVWDDDMLEGFDSNLKLMPPLREKEDRQALIQGLLDGTIDCISANHLPLDPESKDLEFPYADFGASGLETVFGLYKTHLSEKIPLEVFIGAVALNPRYILGLPGATLQEGQGANLSFFIPDSSFTFTRTQSRSHNTHLLGQTLQGRVWGVFNRGQLVVQPE